MDVPFVLPGAIVLPGITLAQRIRNLQPCFISWLLRSEDIFQLVLDLSHTAFASSTFKESIECAKLICWWQRG